MNQEESSLTRTLKRLRWLVPLFFSLGGLVYVLFETLVQHQHELPHSQQQVITSLFYLSVLGPAATYGGLSWVLRAARRLDAADAGLRRQNRQLAILNEVGRLANRPLDPDQVLSQSLDGLLKLMDQEIGIIWLRQGDRLQLSTVRGVATADLVQEQSLPVNDCLCGQTAQLGQLLTLEALHQRRQHPAGNCACEAFAFAVGVPIRTSGAVVGVLEVASHTPTHLEPGELEMLETLGFQIGLAMEKARLNHQLTQMNEELERLVDERTSALRSAKRELAEKAASLRQLLVQERKVEETTRAAIAQDLHDGVRQLIVGALFEVQAIREAAERNSAEDVSRELRLLDEILQRIEVEMQAAIYSLRPATLDALGLVGAIQECAAIFEHSSQIPCRLTVVGQQRRLGEEVELAALRIVQEALNNVHRHSQASESSLLIHYRPESLEITISDDGVGYQGQRSADRPGPAGGHLGLLGMQERAESAGGRLHIESRPGRGTSIRLILELEPENAWEVSALSL